MLGKQRYFAKVVDALKARNVSVGGMLSREVREGGVRVGFEIINLASGKRGWLAHVNLKGGPQIGKYHVNIQELNNIGVQAIQEATEKCNVIAIDEIGPMELFSLKFLQAVEEALKSEKLVLAVVHARAKDILVNKVKQRGDIEIYTVTLANRNSLLQDVANQAQKILY